ncbi:hypothetical protein [Streptomyces sp. NBC_01167]|uniref:hypothetical protein n=1 Tax=unclassified Streptomyces TaxID=2593676 RepID=UPI00386B3F80|nr:hypothetical protein OG317_35285 [Streptomyces sp. NBC_01167]
MGWITEEFGDSHEGITGAVLADGHEPKPVYLDFGSGSGSVHETSEWWAYNGELNRPRAAAVRAACACGWRGPDYPIAWDELPDGGLNDVDTSGPYRDWSGHIATVDRRTVPLPAEVAEAIERLDEQLTTLAEQAPVAALRAAAALERITAAVGLEAAHAVQADELSFDTIATALGISPQAARSRLTRYLLTH